MTVLKKLYHSILYSWKGLRYAFREEFSFRLEVVGLVFLIPLLMFLPDHLATRIEKLYLLASYLLILLSELLNTGLENIIDHLFPEKNQLAGKVKDLGSAAVFIAVIIHALGWFFILLKVLGV